MHVMLVCGSLRQASGTRAALLIAAEVLRARGAAVDFYDLGEHRLPLYDPDVASIPPMVADFRARALAVDAFIFGTPEYHGAMSGALKNAFDYIGSRYVKNKPVGLLACAGGGKGGVNALGNLRMVVRSVSGLAVPDQVIVDEQDFDEHMNLTHENRRGRIEGMALAVLRYAKLLEMENAGV